MNLSVTRPLASVPALMRYWRAITVELFLLYTPSEWRARINYPTFRFITYSVLSFLYGRDGEDHLPARFGH